MRDRKKIGRIKKDEEVIVDMITEDLQDLYDKMRDICDDRDRAIEIYSEEKTEEAAKAVHFADFAADEAKYKFWTAVHQRYGHWDRNIGIRDGYALVLIGKSKLGGMPESVKKLLGGLGGMIKEEME